MTSGSKVADGSVVYYIDGFGPKAGPYRAWSWTGGDAIQPHTPRSSFPYRTGPKGSAQQKGRRTTQHLPPQPYSKVVWQQYNTFAPARWVGNYYDSFVQADYAVPAGISTYFYETAYEYKLLEKLREKVYGTGFNPAVFVAEGGQALSMIANAATRIGSALGRLRARDPHGVLEALGLEPNDRFSRGLRDRTKALSSSWLEVNYGWLPLLNDAEDGAVWLANALHGTIPGSVRARKTWSHQKSVPPPEGMYEQYHTRRVDIFQLQYVIYGLASQPPYIPSLATVASVAWEKLPYSFVADWFVPIGSYIQACRTASDITGTVVRSLKINSTFLDYMTGPGIILKGGWYAVDAPFRSEMRFNRTVSSEIKVPHPLAYLNDNDGLLQYKSWRHAANAVALLTQRNWTTRT